MRKLLNFLIVGALGLIIASCGDDGGGGGGASSITMGATAQTNKQVVASLQKPTALERMWAFLSGNEANATHETFCTNKQFSLFGGGHVCIEKAYVVFDEIELEQENDPSESDDKVEFGPFIIDLVGFPTDGIPGEITIPVPVGAFDEVKFKIDDLDDDDNDGLNGDDDDHDGIDDDKDDIPVNVSLANIPAGLVKRSLLIIGSARNAADTTTQVFTFSTDIEARIKVPLTQNIFGGDNIITFFDFTTGFGNLAFSQITSTMTAVFNPSGSSSIKCDANNDNIVDATLSPAHQLACRIIKDIDLFEDEDNDDVADVAELRGDDDDPGEVDDSGSGD